MSTKAPAGRVLTVCLAVAIALVSGCGGSRTSTTGTTAPGPASGAGAGHRFYEVYDPPGRVRGTMLTLHSGGWVDRPGDARRVMAFAAVSFRAQGWRVVNVAYANPRRVRGRAPDPGPMLRDVVAFYDQVRRAYPGPICAYGESAGGHLAAMLAIRRPTLTCAVLAAAPLDLPAMLRGTSALGASLITRAFGRDAWTLDDWSPARRWDPRTDRTKVFLTAASNDPLVPAAQARAFGAADPDATRITLPGAHAGDPQATGYVHSAVDPAAMVRATAALGAWLERVVPSTAAITPRPADAGAGCDRGPSRGGGAGRREAGWELLRAGDAWRQSATPNQPLVATRGCSGSARRQDEGLSLWALPTAGATVPRGSEAALTYTTSHPLHRVVVSFRGFLARPRDWAVGLYASPSAGGRPTTAVAECRRARCRRLRLVQATSGMLIAAPGGGADPDAVDEPAPETLPLPPGTRRLAWRLTCVNAAGCSVAGVAPVHAPGRAPRDPLGHPAIFSFYRVTVR